MGHSYSQFTLLFVTAIIILYSHATSIQFAPYFTHKPSSTIAQKNKPLVLECKAAGNPKPSIKWKRNGQDIIPDDRRYILPDGSLFFNNVIHSKGNRPDEGQYQCTASSQVGGQSYSIVSRTINLQVAGLSSRIAISPASLDVFYGDMARLQCTFRHSVPKPNITWTFQHPNGTTEQISLSRKHIMISSGVLQIGNVQSSDAGKYSCTAYNKLAQRSHSSSLATLTLKKDSGAARRPQFIAKPLSTNTTKGGRVVLECAATGNPTPKVQWFKDSKPLSYDNRIKRYGVSNLAISDVLSSDEGVYTCKISSGSLSKSADAKLLVHYPPVFTTKPKDRNAHVNTDVTFYCKADGNPVPTISWLKNGISIGQSDYINITSKSLFVMSILTLDTGIYQCVARNYLGEIQSSAELAVFEKGIELPGQTTTTRQTTTTSSTTATTKQRTSTTSAVLSTTETKTTKKAMSVPGPPQNVKCRTQSEKEIQLSWDPPAAVSDAILQYKIFMTSDSQSGTKNDMKSTKGGVYKITLSKLQPDIKYTFMVFAINKHGTGMISLKAFCWTASNSRPGVPISLAAVGTSSSQIKVQWGQPTTGTNVREYIVEYKEAVEGVNNTLYTVTSRKHKTLKNLKTYTKYQIWVFSVDGSNMRSHPAETVATTLGGVPKGKPLDVRVIGDDSGTSLIVTWKPPHFDLINAEITRYLLEYRKPGQDAMQKQIDGKVLKHRLIGLDKNSVYEVRLAAGSPSGYGDSSQWTHANTSITKCSETQRPGRPTDLELSTPVHGVPNIKVTWQPPLDASQWCVTGYVIEYGEGAPVSPKIQVNASTRMFLIQQGLRAGREYVVKLEAINSKNHNGQKVQKTIKVPAFTVKRKPVQKLQVIPLSSRSVKVTWVEFSQHGPYLYHVYWLLKKTAVYCGNTTKLSITCTELQPYTYYKFVVRRFDERNNATASNKTLEEKPNPPLDITGRLTEDNSSDLVLSWQPPEKVNGKIIKYRIFYTTNLTIPNRQWTRIEVKGNSLNTRITNLQPDVEYYFKIKVQNGAGWSDFSKTKLVPTYDKNVDDTKDENKGNIDAQSAEQGGLRDKTLWIVIAAVAGVTLIAIIVISVILCKKRGEDSSPLRKPPPTYKAAVMSNGSSKKKHKDKENKRPDLWINHNDNTEMKPLFKTNHESTNIPRNSMEMKPLDDRPIDKIKVNHERSSFRKGSHDQDLPPPPAQLLDPDDDVDAPSPLAIPDYSPYRPVVSYPRDVAPDDGTAQLSYPDYPITSTPKQNNTVPRENDHNTPLLRSHSDDIDQTPTNQPQAPIYAVPNPKNKSRPSEPRYQTPVSHGSPPVEYSIPNGHSKDIVADLDSQLAGLEGLMKDLNEITTSREYLT